MVELVLKSCLLSLKIFGRLAAWSICRDTRRHETFRDIVLKKKQKQKNKNKRKLSYFYSQDHEDKPARHLWQRDIPPERHVTGLTQQFWMKIEKEKKKKKEREMLLRVEQRCRRDSLLMTTNICLCFVSTLVHLWPLKSGASRGHTQSAGNSTTLPEGNTHTHTHTHTHTPSTHTSAVRFCTVMTEQDKDPTSSDKGFNPNLSRL